MKMKRVFFLLLVVSLAFGSVGCSDGAHDDGDLNNGIVSGDENSSSGGSVSNNGNIFDNENVSATSKKILTVYFSCTGTTKKVAGYVKTAVGGEIYEITAKKPYTQADLNYINSNSRTSIENSDEASRPEIASVAVENFADYDTIFIGYPIWFGKAPKIIYTFMEKYDFSNKTIIPFCTSASSGIGSSATNLHSLTKGNPNWDNGRRFSSNASKTDVADWAKEVITK